MNGQGCPNQVLIDFVENSGESTRHCRQFNSIILYCGAMNPAIRILPFRMTQKNSGVKRAGEPMRAIFISELEFYRPILSRLDGNSYFDLMNYEDRAIGWKFPPAGTQKPFRK
jgi:hypothetical protein